MPRFHQNNLKPALDTRYALTGNQQFGLIVAGAGTAGLAAAIKAARAGHRSPIVARVPFLEEIPGICLCTACAGFTAQALMLSLYPRTVALPWSSPAASVMVRSGQQGHPVRLGGFRCLAHIC